MSLAWKLILLALVSAALVRAMIAWPMLDQPTPRKLHRRPVPTGGGVGIVAAFMLGAWLGPTSLPIGVLLGAGIIALVSLADDALDWPFTVKLLAQELAALLVVGGGLYLGDGPIGMAMTFLWLVFATNAMNFMDGMNGLAGGVALIASLFLAGFGTGFVPVTALLLAAGLVGFLPFNFPRARIFMGDVGSQFCGFMLGVLGVAVGRMGADMLIAPMLLSGLLWDVSFTLVRRAMAGEKLTQAHRGHLYQRAQQSGMDPRLVALLHWGFAALGGVAAFGFIATNSAARWIFTAALLLPQLWWTIYVRHRAPLLTEPGP